jgi:hypothetical protein
VEEDDALVVEQEFQKVSVDHELKVVEVMRDSLKVEAPTKKLKDPSSSSEEGHSLEEVRVIRPLKMELQTEQNRYSAEDLIALTAGSLTALQTVQEQNFRR